MKTTIVIDTHNLLYRNHYTHQNLTSDEGHHTGAMFGTLMALYRHRMRYPKAEIIFVWDGPPGESGQRSWRYEAYPKYKANRKHHTPEPDDNVKMVHSQMDPLYMMLHYAGYLQYRIPGLEADDMIGLTVSRLHNKLHRVFIDSSDKDFHQLLGYGSNVRILFKGKQFGSSQFQLKYGIWPSQWVGYRALMGDPSDCIPGIYGCGPAGAAKLMNMGALPARPWTAQNSEVQQQVKEKLWKNVPLWYKLSEIITRSSDPLLLHGLSSEKHSTFVKGLIRHKPPKPQKKRFVGLLAEYNLRAVMEHQHQLIAVRPGG